MLSRKPAARRGAATPPRNCVPSLRYSGPVPQPTIIRVMGLRKSVVGPGPAQSPTRTVIAATQCSAFGQDQLHDAQPTGDLVVGEGAAAGPYERLKNAISSANMVAGIGARSDRRCVMRRWISAPIRSRNRTHAGSAPPNEQRRRAPRRFRARRQPPAPGVATSSSPG